MTQSPSPFFARPLFWGALFLFLLLAYAGWLVWLQWQAAETLKRGQALALERQIERNALLDAEVAKLREALNLDPCLLRDILRDMPRGK